MAEIVVRHPGGLLQVQEVVGAAQTSAAVGGKTRGSTAAENDTVRNAAAASSKLAPPSNHPLGVVESLRINRISEQGEDRLRSLSPEYVDAVQEQDSEMGETVAARKDANEVEGGRGGGGGIQKVVLLRDPNHSSLSDHGIGIRVAGGVRCEKCGDLHAVITDISNNLTSDTNLSKGLAVLEWCGRSIDSASYEEVRSIMAAMQEESKIELTVKECRGPPPDSRRDISAETSTSDTSTNINGSNKTNSQVPDLRYSPSHSPSGSTDREPSYTPKSLSPSPSPVRSRTCTPIARSASTTPSPTPPPSPRSPQHGKQVVDPGRPALVNLSQTDIVVAPKFMVNGVPTSPPQKQDSTSKNITVENIGGPPVASVHMSLRHKEDEKHLRILLHEVKLTKKKNGSNISSKSSETKLSTAQGNFFINAYLFPDVNNQGVKSCEVLSHVSDLENPQFYTLDKQQLMSVALRVILFEDKNSKHPHFIGEVLVALSDRSAVRLEGHPSWFTMCKTDPNLVPPPPPYVVKRKKKEDIFYRVRRGTGYALQSLRRPMSMGIEALAAENGHLSSSSSMDDNLESSIKKLQAANVTIPRRVRKERKPLSALFTSPQHTSSVTTATVATTTTADNGTDRLNGRELPGDFLLDQGGTASLSVPTSPLLSRKPPKDGGTLARRKKLGAILNVLRSSLLSSSHGGDQNSSPRRKRASTEADTIDGPDSDKKRRWSLSGDMKHRIFTTSPPPTSAPYSASSSPFSSPRHKQQPLATGTPPLAKINHSHRRVHSAVVDYKLSWEPDDAPEKTETNHNKRGSASDLLVPDKSSGVLLSDGSWYSAEEELELQPPPPPPMVKHGTKVSPKRKKMTRVSNSASKLLYSRAYTVDNSLGQTAPTDPVNQRVKVKSRSVEDLLDTQRNKEHDQGGEGGGGVRLHQPVTRTGRPSFTPGSSGSSFDDDYATANSGSDDPPPGIGDGEEREEAPPEESSLDISTRVKAIGRANAISQSPKFRAISLTTAAEGGGHHQSSIDDVASEERISRWRSFEDLLGALPLQKRKPKWLKRNRTHHVSSRSSPSPLLKRRSSEPAISQSPPVGSVRLELTYNPDTSMIGVRLHKHTLSDNTTAELRVQTYLYSRVSEASQEPQQKTVSFKKTDYSHTLVACFTCESSIADLTLQVSLECIGRFFSRVSGHVVLDLGPLLLSSPSHSVTRWFPLFQTPCYPPNNAHHLQQEEIPQPET